MILVPEFMSLVADHLEQRRKAKKVDFPVVLGKDLHAKVLKAAQIQGITPEKFLENVIINVVQTHRHSITSVKTKLPVRGIV